MSRPICGRLPRKNQSEKSELVVIRPGLTNKLLSVQPDFHPVVEKGEEGGQWERSHEDRDETELKHWKKWKKKS